MARLGSIEKPAQSNEPMPLARAFVDAEYTTESGRHGLAYALGGWWAWEKEMWERVGEDRLELRVWRWAENAYYVKTDSTGTPVTKKLKPEIPLVKNVMAALKAVVELPYLEMPVWLEGREEKPPVGTAIAFRDAVMNAGGEGTELPVARDETWFSASVIPTEWGQRETEVPCPRWWQALGEWSQGDVKWEKLLQRWMGYCLMNHRKYAKWMLMEGEARGGKGTVSKVLEMLMGRSAFLSLSLMDLQNTFGLDGLQYAKVLNFTEVGSEEHELSNVVTKVMKCVLGEDAVTINAKFQRPLQNVRIRAAMMMSSNSVPRLSNEGRGISSKMLVLPFRTVFDGREGRPQPDPHLIDTLRGELAGIARWAFVGAMELEQMPMEEKWPQPDYAQEMEEEFLTQNNPIDMFLKARFMPSTEGFVPAPMLWDMWTGWMRATGTRVEIPRNMLVQRMKRGSSWSLQPHRRLLSDGTRVRGLKGLLVRKDVDDGI